MRCLNMITNVAGIGQNGNTPAPVGYYCRHTYYSPVEAARAEEAGRQAAERRATVEQQGAEHRARTLLRVGGLHQHPAVSGHIIQRVTRLRTERPDTLHDVIVRSNATLYEVANPAYLVAVLERHRGRSVIIGKAYPIGRVHCTGRDGQRPLEAGITASGHVVELVEPPHDVTGNSDNDDVEALAAFRLKPDDDGIWLGLAAERLDREFPNDPTIRSLTILARCTACGNRQDYCTCAASGTR